MRLTCTLGLTLLLLFQSLPMAAFPPAGSTEGPLTEIVLDCSLAMKAESPDQQSRIEVAWKALARHYQRLAQEKPAVVRPPALRLAGGSTHSSNPWKPGMLVHDGGPGPLPFLPGQPLPQQPLAGGLLLLTEALTAAADHLQHQDEQSQGFILLVAAGWEGGSGNPHLLGKEQDKQCQGPVVHVIGLAPRPAESRQLRRLAAGHGGIYHEVAGQAGLEQALHFLARSGGIRFTAASTNGAPPPAGSRLRVADRRGWYKRDFDYQAWVDLGSQIWVPAGPYDLELTCSGRSSPFPVPPLSVEPGQISRRRLTLPEQGQVRISLISPAGSTRDGGAAISVFDEQGRPVYRLNDRDQCVIPLFPGGYQARIRSLRFSAGLGELTRELRVLAGEEDVVEIELPSEGLVVIPVESDGSFRIRIERLRGQEVWSGLPGDPISLPEGRYRLRLFGENGTLMKSKRFRIRGGETCRLGPF